MRASLAFRVVGGFSPNFNDQQQNLVSVSSFLSQKWILLQQNLCLKCVNSAQDTLSYSALSVGFVKLVASFVESFCQSQIAPIVKNKEILKEVNMTPLLLRYFWSAVEETQTNLILNLDDNSLIQSLLRQIHQACSLDRTEADALNEYIQAKLPLIRDLAEGRS
jgi:hypothetical protein